MWESEKISIDLPISLNMAWWLCYIEEWGGKFAWILSCSWSPGSEWSWNPQGGNKDRWTPTFSRLTVLPCSYRKDEILSWREKQRKSCCLDFSIVEVREWFGRENVRLSFRWVMKQKVFSSCATQKCDSFTTQEIFFHRMLFSFFSCWFFLLFVYHITSTVEHEIEIIMKQIHLFQQILI